MARKAGSAAGWRKLAAEVGFSIRDEDAFNGMRFAVLERPGQGRS